MPNNIPSWALEKRICPVCGAEFYPNAANQKYCQEAHKQRAENRRFYQAHREQIISAVIARRKEKS